MTKHLNISSPSLKDLQQQFSLSLYHHPSNVERLIKPTAFTAEQKLQLYRNNFILSLIDVMSATYPVVESLVGKEYFSYLAKQYIRQMPLNQGNVGHYGAQFDDFIYQQTELSQQLPYLAEMARFEYQIDQLQLKPSSTTIFPHHKLTHLTEQRLLQAQFKLASNCEIFSSQYAICSLWHLIVSQQESQLESLPLTQNECCFLLWRNDKLQLIITDQVGIELYRIIEQNQRLCTASADVLAQLPMLITEAIVVDMSFTNPKETSHAPLD